MPVVAGCTYLACFQFSPYHFVHRDGLVNKKPPTIRCFSDTDTSSFTPALSCNTGGKQ
uniref:Uncharacterized protein n=1 Tax=Anguilla anguilla TaxID=7936 RepID=A0A0E9RUD2_ANGAN